MNNASLSSDSAAFEPNERGARAPGSGEEVSRSVPYLLTCARRLTHNETDARDLVQDTCLRALEGLERLHTAPDNMRAWLLVIMRRHWFNVLRQRRAHGTVNADFMDGGGELCPADRALVETRASFDQFERAWRTLTPGAQSIAEQCLIRDESYELVSDRLGVAKATIATSIHRTRNHLRSLLLEH